MPGRTVWKDKFIVDVYLLAKGGMTEFKMAQVLGVSLPTFRSWRTTEKVFRDAIQRGRKEYRGRNDKVTCLSDYVYNRLSSKLRKVWKKINKLDRAKGNLEKIEAILDRKGKNVRQHLFVYAWTRGNFSISQALRKVNISRTTLERWKKDPDFAELLNELVWHKKNFFEDSLCRLIKSGDTSAIIFANRTFNRDRGFNEKVEVDMNLSGELNQNVMSVDMMKLPLQARKEILKSLRNNKQS